MGDLTLAALLMLSSPDEKVNDGIRRCAFGLDGAVAEEPLSSVDCRYSSDVDFRRLNMIVAIPFTIQMNIYALMERLLVGVGDQSYLLVSE